MVYRFVVLSVVLYALFMVQTYIRINPYQYVYFNAFVGGLKGASQLEELDYWGQSLKELVERTKSRLQNGRFYKFKVSNVSPGQAEEHFNEYMFLSSLESFDCMFTIWNRRIESYVKEQFPDLVEFDSVKRFGVALSKTLCRQSFFQK